MDNKWHAFVWDGNTFKKDAYSYSYDQLQDAATSSWMNNGNDMPLAFEMSSEGNISACSADGTVFEATATLDAGRINIHDIEEKPGKKPSIRASLRLTNDGRLVGSYYVRMNGGKEQRGKLDMRRQTADYTDQGGFDDYAE